MEEKHIAPGIDIIGFSSLEEMLQYQERQRMLLAEAFKNVLPQQLWVDRGSYAIRILREGEEIVLIIFGRVYDEEEFTFLEITAGASTTNGELDAILNRYRQLHREGYRYGRWYSDQFPDGEIGDAHVTDLWPITEADYHHALNNNWECPGYLLTRVLDEINDAITTREDNHE